MNKINIYDNTAQIAEAFAGLLSQLKAEQDDAPIHVALSGGNTPKEIFSYLLTTYHKDLLDDRFHFWWGDERCVPLTHEESNYRWASELWLKPAGVSEKNIHRIAGENDPIKEAERYAKEMRQWIQTKNDLPVFDLNLLGIGEDGHTASIFPDQKNLLSSDKWCEVATHPVSGQKRITLSGPVLNNSNMVVFLATGAGKAKMVKNVAVEARPEYPASHIFSKSRTTIWLLDRAAAEGLNH